MRTVASISVLMILFLLPCANGKAQTGTYIYPFTIQVQDSAMKEIGYFKYDTSKNTVVTRGTLKASFGYFVKQVFIPFWELVGAMNLVSEQLYPDGTIKNVVEFRNAVANYWRVRKKWGM